MRYTGGMIYWNADLAEKIACTRQEMDTLPSHIDHLIELAKTIDQSGIQPSADQFSSEKDSFLRYGLRLLGEGFAGEILEEILAVLLYVSSARGLEFLRQCIDAEALLSIANDEDQDTLTRKLLPYCGIDTALTSYEKRNQNHAN